MKKARLFQSRLIIDTLGKAAVDDLLDDFRLYDDEIENMERLRDQISKPLEFQLGNSEIGHTVAFGPIAKARIKHAPASRRPHFTQHPGRGDGHHSTAIPQSQSAEQQRCGDNCRQPQRRCGKVIEF